MPIAKPPYARERRGSASARPGSSALAAQAAPAARTSRRSKRIAPSACTLPCRDSAGRSPMLSRFDDYPIHQTPEPIAQPATSDRNAYDRYWFNGYADDGEFYFGVGAALYPNLGIMDCGFSIVRDGEQHAFHASRRAPPEPRPAAAG